MNAKAGSQPSAAVIDILSSSEEEEDELPVLSLYRNRSKNTPMKDENKKTKKKKTFEDFDEDCIILDHDPFVSVDVSCKLSITNHNDTEEDISIIAEKGEVACRDFPHSRHLCVKFPFNTTPHLSYCPKCYCYVCDSAAPCIFWTDILGGHCHAEAEGSDWDAMRLAARPTTKPN